MTQIDPMIGRLVGKKYRVIDYIGGGGFGAVYRAEQEPVGRVVALKVIKKSDQDEEELRARFLREARSAACLKSPHIVTLFDYGEEPDGTLYMVFEFVEGLTLKAILLKEKTLPVDRATEYAIHILEGLSVAHMGGIVHRDLKPANIMIAKGAWGYNQAKVLDFGVAKMLESNANDPLQASTRRGLVLGTPHYMSPEQARTVGVDARADLYAMGTLLYVMVAGEPPFSGETTFAILQAHVQKPADGPISRLDAPEGFKAVLLRALQKKPEDRYESARDMAAALAPFARSPGENTDADNRKDSDSQALASLAPDAAFALQSRDSRIVDAASHPGSPRKRYAIPVISLCLVGAVLTWYFLSTPEEPTPLPEPVVVRSLGAAGDMGSPKKPVADEASAPDGGPAQTAVAVDSGAGRAESRDANTRAEVDQPDAKPAPIPVAPRPRKARRPRKTRRPPIRSAPKPEAKKETSPEVPTMEEF